MFHGAVVSINLDLNPRPKIQICTHCIFTVTHIIGVKKKRFSRHYSALVLKSFVSMVQNIVIDFDGYIIYLPREWETSTASFDFLVFSRFTYISPSLRDVVFGFPSQVCRCFWLVRLLFRLLFSKWRDQQCQSCKLWPYFEEEENEANAMEFFARYRGIFENGINRETVYFSLAPLGRRPQRNCRSGNSTIYIQLIFSKSETVKKLQDMSWVYWQKIRTESQNSQRYDDFYFWSINQLTRRCAMPLSLLSAHLSIDWLTGRKGDIEWTELNLSFKENLSIKQSMKCCQQYVNITVLGLSRFCLFWFFLSRSWTFLYFAFFCDHGSF